MGLFLRHNKMSTDSKILKLRSLCCGLAAAAVLAAAGSAATVPAGSYATFGVSSDEITVPKYGIISDAELVIYGITPADTNVDVYLLDNPRPGFTLNQKPAAGSTFSGYGVKLNGTLENGIYVCSLSDVQNNDPQSHIYDTMPSPFEFRLYRSRSQSDYENVIYTSALLELIDDIGTGGTFGIGIEAVSGESFTFTSIKLRVTVSSYHYYYATTDKTYTFSYSADPADDLSGYALQFDGIDSFARVGYKPPQNAFTVAAWVKATEEHEIDIENSNSRSLDGLTGQKYVFAPERLGGTALSTCGGMGVSVGTNGVSVYEYYSTTAPALAVYEGDLGTDWNHIAVTYSNRQSMIYINGDLVHVGRFSSRTKVCAPLQFGGSELGYFKGKIGNMIVLDKALTAEQVVSLANDQFTDFTPVGSWILDEGFGTVAFDSSGNGYRMRLNNTQWTPVGDELSETEIAAASSVDITNTHTESVLEFSGRKSYATLNYTPPVNNFTVSAWVKATAKHQIDKQNITGGAGRSGQKYVFAPERRGGTLVKNNGGMGVSVGTNGISVYEYYDSAAPALAVYQNNLGTDWNHITVTYTDKQPRIYLNGRLVYIGFQSVQGDIYAPINIGGNGLGYFRGQVANVCVFDRPLSADEVVLVANDYIYDLNPLGVWLLGEGEGTTLFDSSGNERHGTAYGAFWSAL